MNPLLRPAAQRIIVRRVLYPFQQQQQQVSQKIRVKCCPLPLVQAVLPGRTARRLLSSSVSSSSSSWSPPSHHNQENDDDDEEEWQEGQDNEQDEKSHQDNWMPHFLELKQHLEDLRREKGLQPTDPAPFPATKKMRNFLSKTRWYFKVGRFGNGPQDEERIEMLESIGIDIDPFSTKWETQFQRLQEFVEKNGCFPYDIEVDKLDDEGIKVLEWTRRQKNRYRAFHNGEQISAQTPERIAKLEAIGFSWNKHDHKWMGYYQELVEYYNYHGHSMVPSTHPANQTLANWVSDQRILYNRRKKKGTCKQSVSTVVLSHPLTYSRIMFGRSSVWSLR